MRTLFPQSSRKLGSLRVSHRLEAKCILSPTAEISNLFWVMNSLGNLMKATDFLPDIDTHVRMHERLCMQLLGLMSVIGLPKSRI